MTKSSISMKLVVAVLACFALLGAWWFISNSSSPKITVGAQSYETYFRINANYTYKSATGPQPWSFNVVAGCGVSLTKYITGDISGVSQRIPTLYALPTSDGHALMIEVVKACGGQTTENGQVPKDFFPAIVYYERADNLSLGMLYLSEDAYEGPLSKLTFHGATVSAATQEEFERWMETDGKKNLISLESSKELQHGTKGLPITEELKQDPGSFWKTRMPKNCHGVLRLKMPETMRNFIRVNYWPATRPQYWALSREQSLDIQAGLSGKSPDHLLANVLFDGYRFETYGLRPTADYGTWATGLINRNGGGSFAWSKPDFPDLIQALPASYFPLTASEASPWLRQIDPQVTKFSRNIELGGEEKKGFFYCYEMSSPWTEFFAKNFNPQTDTALFPSYLTVDGREVNNSQDSRASNFQFFFDKDEYIYWRGVVLL